MFRYGTFVVARQYLLYIADQSQFLWLLFVQLFLPNPEAIIGYWVLAAGSDGILAMASDISGPIFPAMAEAFGKKDLALCESYWLTVMKWFTLFSGFGLFFYLGWSNIYITALSGDAWAESGYILLLITPAIFIRKANDTFTGILQGINAPHDVLIGTALRIPILVFGGFILFKYWGILGMAITWNLMELVFVIYMYLRIKHILKIRTPIWLITIPFIVGLIAMLITKGIMVFFPTND